MKNITIAFVPLFILAGCTSVEDGGESGVVPVEQDRPEESRETYNQESWKTIIPDTCKSFNDGCNNCQRMEDGMAACTKMACAEYAMPKCLDEEASESTVPTEEAKDTGGDYEALTVEEAKALAEQYGVPFRIVEQDGEPLPATMDWRPGRVNASVEGDIVVSVQIEGAE